ncbi:MAG: DUF6089 family protein [Flavobacteriaceae bacterium]|jgi:hypothetical protein|nr:DUF6089 family protein [Flavobacteriaceae bacterium]
MKKYFLFTIILFAFCFKVNAQRHEIGGSLGVPNIIGDIGKTGYIQAIPDDIKNGLPFSIGALYRFNFNNRQGVRLNLVYNRVYFNDKYAAEDYRYKRGLHGKNDIFEASILFEYNFFDINNEQKSASSPYIFGGIAAVGSRDPKYTIDNVERKDSQGNPLPPAYPNDFDTFLTTKNSSAFSWGIPFGIGYKIKFNYNWNLSFEIGARYTATDNLDFSAEQTSKFTTNIDPALVSSPLYEGGIDQEIERRKSAIIGEHQTGNLFKSNDWYVVTGINLTYSFGRPPCFCD